MTPVRGEVWFVDFDPVVGREQAGRRPALVVSGDRMNRSPTGIVVVLPITGTDRGYPAHVSVAPPEGGLTKPSVIMADQPRAISRDRLGRRHGSISPEAMKRVEQALRFVLDL